MNLQTAPRRSNAASTLLMALGALAFALLLSIVLSESASAHGYMETPASRALLCKDKQNTNCGAVQYEPQSLEAIGGFPQTGPADGQITGAGIFKELYEQTNTRWKKVNMTGGKQTFTWKLTAAHVSDNWRYYITKKDWDPSKPLTRADLEPEPFCFIDYKDAKPPSTVSHECSVPTDRSGYHLILGVWEIADTVNAFYQVIDVNLTNDGSTPQPQPEPPSAPGKLESALQTAKSIVLSWLPSSSELKIQKYDIYRDGVLCGSTPHTTFTDEGLQADKAYTYTVRAVDVNGKASPHSTPLTVRTLKEENGGGNEGGGNNGGENGNSQLPQWEAKSIYLKGDKVQYKGLEYEAQYWTQNNAPDASAAWKLLSNVTVDWNSSKAYLGGDRVTYNGVTYIARWWTLGDKPDQSDVWQKA
ncbi:chitin-binding protein [Paenibacillus pinisoli]|uniref:Chitin-binding protein n=1 Tax=Paenibacillus pinisoli TaxID=1276110 RepID=A0A3A6PXL6_9BACL|nr:lytic polysaccharide monooxygenase [Paenibacillus pinisoli]RJX40113.1 chitin-binding protein [Paenibacillus pinisoli]